MSVKLKLNQALINGSMEYWQRNTSFAAAANATYTADRWQYIKNTSNANLVHTISRSVDVPSSAFGVYSLLATPTAFQSSPLNAADYVAIQQKIEGNILRSFKGKKLVLSFWVKAYKAGTYCVAFRNADTTSTPSSTRSLVKEYTINASNTWEQKTIRITHDTSGTWAYDTGVGMTVSFTIAAGSTYQGPKDAWLNGSYLATSSQVNGVDSTSDLFYLSDVCLVEDNDGQTRTPDFTLAARDVFGELLLCQRYYEKSSDYGQIANHSSGYIQTYTNTNGAGYTFFTYKSVKRATPLVTSNSTISSTVGYSGLSQISFSYTGTANTWYTNYFTADAELS
jgi:hypothetical protein